MVSYDLDRNTFSQVLVPGVTTPGFILPLKCKKNRFISGNHLSTAKFYWNGVDNVVGAVNLDLFTVESSPELSANNYLAGKVSPGGKFYGGTYRTGMCGDTPPTRGGLYRYDQCNSVTQLINDFKVTGGFEWNKEENKFYFDDSCTKTIREYDYDRKTDTICEFFIFVLVL